MDHQRRGETKYLAWLAPLGDVLHCVGPDQKEQVGRGQLLVQLP